VSEIGESVALADLIDVMLSASENGEVKVDGALASLVDSIDVTLSVSENGEVIVDGELMAAVEGQPERCRSRIS
jgi:hypothetical protein